MKPASPTVKRNYRCMGRRRNNRRSPATLDSQRRDQDVLSTDSCRSVPEPHELADSHAPTPPRYQVLIICAFLLLAVGLVFGQTIGHDFVNIDDNNYVHDNPLVARGLNGQISSGRLRKAMPRTGSP